MVELQAWGRWQRNRTDAGLASLLPQRGRGWVGASLDSVLQAHVEQQHGALQTWLLTYQE